MESVYNFEMAGKWWSDEEDLKLLKHYNEDGLNVVQIAKLHNRFPRGIASRLVYLRVVDCTLDCRGYIQNEKEDCQYYEQIKNFLKQKRDERKEKKIDKLKKEEKGINSININIPSTSKDIENKIENLQNEIIKLNDKLDTILLILQSVHNIEIEEVQV